ncbi:MAG: hypothetical protein Q4G44_10155, partial [Alcaligenaceae bacterium]|nr:hypothetical protein [Alcaligenaceae bacterium]
MKEQRKSNYIYPESTWSVRLISALCVGALFGGTIALINYSHAIHAPQAADTDEQIVEVAFFAPEAPMPLGEQLEDPNLPAAEELVESSEEVVAPEPEPEPKPKAKPRRRPA